MAFRVSTLLLAAFAVSVLLGAPVAPEWAVAAARGAARLLGTWSAMSFASLLLVLPAFRAQAWANERAARQDRRLAWLEAAAPAPGSARA
jgi:hypothetical protein